MNLSRWMAGLSCLLMAAGTILAEEAGPIPGIGPKGEVARVHTGFAFTEGPAADAKGNLYFSDVRANRVHKLDADGKLSTFLEDSGGCNGLMFDKGGRLIACQGVEKRIVAIDVASKAITPIAEQFDGKSFDRPNDLAVDRQGGVYFTDPNVKSVYYVADGGKVTRLIDDLPRPNGVRLSPDGRTLYVGQHEPPDDVGPRLTRSGRNRQQRQLLSEGPASQRRSGKSFPRPERAA